MSFAFTTPDIRPDWPRIRCPASMLAEAAARKKTWRDKMRDRPDSRSFAAPHNYPRPHYVQPLQPVPTKCRLRGEIVSAIIRNVATAYGLTLDEMKDNGKTTRRVNARFAAIYAIKARFPLMSLPQIASAMSRDHTSILNALRKVDARIASGQLPNPMKRLFPERA